MSLTKLGFKKKEHPSWRRPFDIGAATIAGGLTNVVPGVPLGAGIIAGIAPEQHKTELAAKATVAGGLAGIPVTGYAIRTLAKDVSKTNKPDYGLLKQRALSLGKELKEGTGNPNKPPLKEWQKPRPWKNRWGTLKHMWKRGRGATKRTYLAGIAASAVGTGLGYAVASKPYYKKAELIKLGFHPESFTRPSEEKDQAFIRNYPKEGMAGKAKRAVNSPLTWALGGVSLFLTHKKRSDSPESFWPYLTGGMLAAIAVKRWSNASKREKQKFVKEYNATMGTTFTIDHPKMQSLWNMTHARANRIDRMRDM